jgi:multiple sugar transport system substrate-binding protein
MQRLVTVLFAAVLATAPLGAQAADLVVWWDKGFYHEEDAAIEEVIAAFEQETGKQVDLVLDEQAELPDSIEAAIAANQPPDVAFGLWLSTYFPKWALRIGS